MKGKRYQVRSWMKSYDTKMDISLDHPLSTGEAATCYNGKTLLFPGNLWPGMEPIGLKGERNSLDL